jgi:hypothetical protein
MAKNDMYRVVATDLTDDSKFKSGLKTKADADAYAKKLRNSKRKDGAKSMTDVKVVKESKQLAETSYDADIDDNQPVIVQGVKGMNSKSFRKKFRNMAAFGKWADSDAAGDFEVHQVTNESKQLSEGVLDDHDDDGFMAKRQLYDLAKYSVQLHKMIQDSDNLEPWMQAKITKAADYISTVKHVLEYRDVRGAEDAVIDFGMDDIADIEPELDVMEGPGVGAPDYNPAAGSYNSDLERGDEIITTDGEHTGVIKKIDGDLAHVEFYSSSPNGEYRDVVPLSTLEFNEYAGSDEEEWDNRRELGDYEYDRLSGLRENESANAPDDLMRKLAQQYQATMAGMGSGDEHEVLDMMQRIADKHGLDVEDYLYESASKPGKASRNTAEDIMERMFAPLKGLK